jgi:hypothetical protein
VRSATFVLDGIGNNNVDIEGLAFALDTPPPPVSRRTILDTVPRAFCKKSAQAIENKGWRSKKERQEILRGGKFLKD